MSAHVRRGAVADDFTGATDLAGNWTARGLRTSVLLGIPDEATRTKLKEDDAVVVALKTRSAPSGVARTQSVRDPVGGPDERPRASLYALRYARGGVRSGRGKRPRGAGRPVTVTTAAEALRLGRTTGREETTQGDEHR